MKRALLILCLCAISINAIAATRAGRPMIIHRLSTMNLEIWTEHDPEWETQLKSSNEAVTFSAETPALTYPPTHMSWTVSPMLTIKPDELEAAASGVIHQVAINYRSQPPEQVTPKEYGDLVGYEATFQAEPHNIPIDVKVFCGHGEGKPLVVMQVVTLQGKLSHVSEHVRRSWTHLRYLE